MGTGLEVLLVKNKSGLSFVSIAPLFQLHPPKAQACNSSSQRPRRPAYTRPPDGTMLRVGSPVQLHSLVKQPELNSLCMEVTLVGASWVVVAGDQTGVDSIPYYMKFCGVPSCLALGVGALSGGARAVGSPTASA